MRKGSNLWWMYTPALIAVMLVFVYPFVNGIRISFTDWNGFSQSSNWVGLNNYIKMIGDPKTWSIVKNTLIYGIGSTILQNIWGLLYALLLVQKLKINAVTRTIVYLPVIVSPLIMGYIWYFIFAYQGGALNDLLLLFGADRINALANTNANVWIIVFVNTYQFMGVAMMIYIAGLQSIGSDYYEAARMDGASALQQFKMVTIPLLMPAVTISFILNIIGGLKLFDVIISLTNGGPGDSSQSLSTFMYALYFRREDAGYATTQGILMATLILCISVLALLYFKRREVEA